MNTVRSLIREILGADSDRFRSVADVTFNIKPGFPDWLDSSGEDEEAAAQPTISQVTVPTPTGAVNTPSGITPDMVTSFVKDPSFRGRLEDPDFELEKRSIPGVTFDSHVNSTVPINRFLEMLRAEVRPEIPIIVASVYRDASRQASAMLGVWRSGGDKQIGVVYNDLVESSFLKIINTYRFARYSDEEIRKIPPPPGLLTALSTMIAGLRASGGAFQTGHMVGRGIDLRVSGMSRSDAEEIFSAAKKIGGNPLFEAHPYHLHITVPNEWSA